MSKHSNHHGNANISGSGTGGINTDAKTGGQNAGSVQSDTAQDGVKTHDKPASEDKDPKTSEAKIAALEDELAGWVQKSGELEAKVADLNDQYLRKAADFENFRKRMNREKQEISDYANQNLILDLLPVIDDFERAIKSAETSKNFNSFFEGVTMIEKQLSTQLENKWGLKRFDSEGELFDPNRHEALQMVKSADVTDPTVKEDYVKGYMLKERVIRFAKVKVAMPEDGDSTAPNNHVTEN